MLSPCNYKQIGLSWKDRGVCALTVLALLCFSSCLPKRPEGGGNESGSGGRSTSDSSPLFTMISLKVGGSNIAYTDSSGIYYSKYDPVSISGACRGGVTTVKVEITPLSQATTTDVVDCISTQYSWSRSLSTQTSYTLKLTPLDASSNAMSGLLPITKQYVYDIVAPSAPTFLTPTTSTSYTVSNGQTSFTITGQVPIDVNELIGPGYSLISLTPNGDGIHQDFSYSLSVPVGSSATANFVAYDKARNLSASAMTITSVLSAIIPVAAADAGSSITDSGVIIHSNVSYHNGISLNSNTLWISGSAGMIGGRP